jgi:hypothetical protein
MKKMTLGNRILHEKVIFIVLIKFMHLPCSGAREIRKESFVGVISLQNQKLSEE